MVVLELAEYLLLVTAVIVLFMGYADVSIIFILVAIYLKLDGEKWGGRLE